MLKVLTNTHDIQHLTIKAILNVQYINNPNIVIENHSCFSQVLEMRITFISNIRNLTYDYFLKQPMPMCEIKLNQPLHKNPEHINCLDRFIFHPFIQEYTHIPALASDFPQLQLFEHD